MALIPGRGVGQSEYAWPVKGEIDLSSGFCDFRINHFHGGIDIRTGGNEGREVYAPVNGYVWRIRYSYGGYGKGLYIKDKSGQIYVFGHLSRLSERLEKIVREEQYRRRSYSLDREFPPDSLAVRKGELVAFSGQTGAGPPHLHFEKRTPKNEPVNPLSGGFPFRDQIAPQIEGLAIQYCDSASIFPNGKRDYRWPAKYSRLNNVYYLDSMPGLTAPFGILLRAFDRVRAGGPQLGIARAVLSIDGQVYHELSLERYDYAQTGMVNLIFDYESARNKEKYYRLYKAEGEKFDGSRAPAGNEGIFGAGGEGAWGRHKAAIEIYDAAGNRSRLEFSFFYLPPPPLYDLAWLSDSTFYLQSRAEAEGLDISGVSILQLTAKGGWRKLEADRILLRGRRDVRVALPGGRNRPRAVRIFVSGQTGWSREDLLYPVDTAQSPEYRLEYELTDNGILFDITTNSMAAPAPQISIRYDDGYSHTVETRPTKANHFGAFYRNRSIGSGIVEIALGNFAGERVATKAVDIQLLNNSESASWFGDESGLAVTIWSEEAGFFAPTYIEMVEEKGWLPNAKAVLSSVYRINPANLPLAGSVVVSLPGLKGSQDSKASVCRMENGNGWSWLDSRVEKGRLRSNSSLLGTFAILKDETPPSISHITPADKKIINSRNPAIKCLISDDLSGIGDDADISITLDGKWLIPEYDYETKELKTVPDRKLSEGKHQLEIKAKDKAGNQRISRTSFTIRSSQKGGAKE